MDKHADWGGLQPALREGALGGALMAYVLRAGHGRDVASLTAGRDQAGG